MTHKERLLRVVAGEDIDRIPWIPRMKLWYEYHRRKNTLPKQYEGWTLREIEEDLGMGTPAREGRVFTISINDNVEIIRQEKEGELTTEYITPKGTLTSRRKSAQKGYDLETVEHLIKNIDAYPPLEYIIENLEITPTFEEYQEYEDQIGEAGVPLVRAGLWPRKSGFEFHAPMHTILRELLGYEKGYIHLHKYPQKVHHLLEVLSEKAFEMQEIVLKSSAKLILYGGHFDGQMTPPPIFKKYFLPHFRDFSDQLHSQGMKLACHLDAETKGLFNLIKEAGFDIAECFTTVPLVQHTTLAEARKKWRDNIIIWGDPSTILEPNYSRVKFEQFMLDLFKTIAPGDNFILGIADNLMPSSDFSRVIEMSEMVQQLGEYPISISQIESYCSDLPQRH